jgi:hypothetical protein
MSEQVSSVTTYHCMVCAEKVELFGTDGQSHMEHAGRIGAVLTLAGTFTCTFVCSDECRSTGRPPEAPEEPEPS